MQCVRCHHTLPPRADRCPRCFTLNPSDRPLVTPFHDSAPAKPLALSIESDPPAAPLALSFDDDSPVPAQAAREEAVTEPAPPVADFDVDLDGDSGPWPSLPDAERSEPGLSAATPLGPEALEPSASEAPSFPEEEAWALRGADAEARSAPRRSELQPGAGVPWHGAAVSDPAPSVGLAAEAFERVRRSGEVPAGKRLLAWSIDAAALLGLFAAFAALAVLLIDPARLSRPGTGSLDYWADLLLAKSLRAPWLCLGAALCAAYSFVFALLGRTPGMAAAGLSLQRAPGPRAALLRAALSLLSAAPALFGFFLGLTTGQTLHDRLSRVALRAEASPE